MFFIVYAQRDGHKQQILANCVTKYSPHVWHKLMVNQWRDTVLVDWDDVLVGTDVSHVACFDSAITDS